MITIDLEGKTSFADYMIVASGRVGRHVISLANDVSKCLKDSGYAGAAIEGQETGDWLLVDGGNIIIHIFRPEIRELYNLEKLWSVSNKSDIDSDESHN